MLRVVEDHIRVHRPVDRGQGDLVRPGDDVRVRHHHARFDDESGALLHPAALFRNTLDLDDGRPDSGDVRKVLQCGVRRLDLALRDGGEGVGDRGDLAAVDQGVDASRQGAHPVGSDLADGGDDAGILRLPGDAGVLAAEQGHRDHPHHHHGGHDGDQGAHGGIRPVEPARADIVPDSLANAGAQEVADHHAAGQGEQRDDQARAFRALVLDKPDNRPHGLQPQVATDQHARQAQQRGHPALPQPGEEGGEAAEH